MLLPSTDIKGLALETLDPSPSYDFLNKGTLATNRSTGITAFAAKSPAAADKHSGVRILKI